jgi:hypothetical protein
MFITIIRKARLILIFIMMLFNVIELNAAEIIPNVIRSGFSEYKTFGSKKAVKAWMKNGPNEINYESLPVINDLQYVDNLYGNYKNYEIIKTVKLSNSTTVLYISINYDLGALFSKFIIYNIGGEELVTKMEVNTNPEIIMPSLDLWRTR